MLDALLAWLDVIVHELVLFAAIGFLIGAADDLLIDVFWIGLRWRGGVGGSRSGEPCAALARTNGWHAVFIPAWREANVIGDMLRTCVKRWPDENVRLFVGCYPNDPDTIRQAGTIAQVDERVEIIVNERAGPTTKADCLNQLWQALLRHEEVSGEAARSVILHDAEDVVHRDEIAIYDAFIAEHAMVQIPVLPLIDPKSRWISGHYIDEFAESHGKYLPTRVALGASLPAAGVGCAFARDMLGQIASARGGAPFDGDSLTEDYELGLRIGELGGKSIFVRMWDDCGGLVAVQEFFPGHPGEAIRQKARWMVGIALAGWDRLGWRGGIIERWMRLRDRRAALSALILLSAYCALPLAGLIAIGRSFSKVPMAPLPPIATTVLSINAVLLFWRLLMRAYFVKESYGWREALRTVPRAVVSNVIAIFAARRAISLYIQSWRGGPVRWEKTQHAFPSLESI